MTRDESRIATILAVETSGATPVWTALPERAPIRRVRNIGDTGLTIAFAPDQSRRQASRSS